MKTFAYVEDYLEVAAGYISVDGKKNNKYFMYPESILQLARYDVPVLNSMGETVHDGKSLTDNQGKLAVKMLLKYRKQFAALGVDVAPLEEPKFRKPLREIDRRRLAYIDKELIKIKFPFQTDIINQVKEWKRISDGTVSFNRDTKLWEFGLTESNINWVNAFAQANQFELDVNITDIMNQIFECEQQPYKIELVATDTGFTITNADASLLEYVERTIGFRDDNLLQLVDASGSLGYTVDPRLLDMIKVDAELHPLLVNKNHNVGAENFELAVKYIKESQRFPAIVYQSNPTWIDTNMSTLREYFDEDEIFYQTRGNIADVPAYVKVIVSTKLGQQIPDCVPVLVTFSAMMFGGEKSSWTQQAEKLIYCCTDTFIRK
jgi:hypothetical protein